MTRRQPVARLRQARSIRPVRRRSGRPSPARAAAALVALAAGAVLYGLVGSPVFGYGRLVVDGARFTSRAEIETALRLPDGTSVFGLSVEELEARLRALPAVEAARVRIVLPETVAVELVEREPILAWRAGGAVYLVDGAGVFFAQIGSDAAADAPTPSSAGGRAAVRVDGAIVPLVEDRRATSRRLGLGATLSAVDLDAARRLGSLRPVDVGSAASSLAVGIDDADGWTIRPAGGEGSDAGWIAVFGIYTPTLRPTTMIPGQVRLLRSLLSDREPEVARVVLASETDGTFVPRASAGAGEGGEQP